MLSFQQLTESRSAPLYHATSVPHALSALIQDQLKGGKFLAPITNPDVADSWDSTYKITHNKAVSTTRDINFAIHWASHAGIIFELDQLAITHHYKVVPFNWFGWTTRKSNGDRWGGSQSEERILTDAIQPFSRYLTRIIVVDHVFFAKFWSKSRESRIQVLRDHPLLYSWREQRFVNS